MAIVLAYWFYIFLIFASFGVGLNSFLKLPKPNPFIIPFIGAFGISLFAGIWAGFGGLSFYFELSLTIIAILIAIWNKKAFRIYFISLKDEIASLPLLLKFLLSIISIFALAQSASAPYILDNESYYIQTIKWLDTYGYVPGLANFHFFLGQNSGWHILQSSLNLDSISPLLNDINGLFLLLANAYALNKLKNYYRTKEFLFLAIGLLPIFNIFLFQFISAPSTDLPVYLITVIVFSEFASYFIKKGTTRTPVLFIFLLVIFAVYIKVTSVFLIFFPTFLYLRNISTFRNDLIKICLFSILTLTLFTIKNAIISGYPLYPLTLFKLETDWVMPLELKQYIVDATRYYAFFLTPEEFDHMTYVQKIVRWVSLPKLHGLFNKSILLLLILFPFIIRIKKVRTPYLLLYIITTSQLLFLWITSPQYRFFFGYLMLLSCLLLAHIIKKKIAINILLIGSTIAIAIPLFLPLNINELTNNPFEQNLNSFSLDYLIIPHSQTKYPKALYTQKTIGNLTYNTPSNIDFFWATGDCDLPCVQEQQLEGFKDYFEQAPQLRSTDLKDGFKSVYFPYE